VNAGVLLLNLTRWRQENLAQRLIGYIEAHSDTLTFHDQDAINAVLHASIRVLARRWNVQAQMYRLRRHVYPDAYAAIKHACSRAAIVHYAGPEKPWRFRMSVARRHLYFQYLRKTQWHGARLQGSAWYHQPECWLSGALDRIGIDYMLVIVLLQKCWRRIGQALIRGQEARPTQDEAILLGDRVIVMTARPGRIKRDIPIALPRPRHPDIVLAPEFLAIKRQILDLLHEEVRRSLGLSG
jgi:hypothetical protein